MAKNPQVTPLDVDTSKDVVPQATNAEWINATLAENKALQAEAYALIGYQPTYQQVIDEWKTIGLALASDTEFFFNKFYFSMVNKIGLQIYHAKSWKHKFSPFRKTITIGAYVEESQTDVYEAYKYDIAKSQHTNFDIEPPKMYTYYHSINNEREYTVTVAEDYLREALIEPNGLSRILQDHVNKLTTSTEIDDYKYFKALLLYAYENDYIYKENIQAPVDDTTISNLLISMQTASADWTEPSRKFNASGITNWSAYEDQYIIMTNRTYATVGVKKFSTVFNLEFANKTWNNIITVADFPDPIPDNAIFLVDRDFWQVYNKTRKITRDYNGKGDYTNYHLIDKNIYSISKLANAMVFTTDTITTSVLTINETHTGDYILNNVYAFYVTNTGNQTASVEWEVTGQTSNLTNIANGVLNIGSDETATTLTITATSTDDESISATLDITVDTSQTSPRV